MKKFSIIFSFILLFSVFFATSSMAADYQNPKDVVVDTTLKYRHYFVFDNYLVFICSDDPSAYGSFPYVFVNASGGQQPYIRVFSGGLVEIFRYSLGSDGNWTNATRGFSEVVTEDYENFNSMYGFKTTSTYYESSLPIKKYEGGEWSVLFQPTLVLERTLAETVQALMTEEVPVAQSQVLGTMNILLLCGVGCLAFLMALPLFGKVLRRFRVL